MPNVNYKTVLKSLKNLPDLDTIKRSINSVSIKTDIGSLLDLSDMAYSFINPDHPISLKNELLTQFKDNFKDLQNNFPEETALLCNNLNQYQIPGITEEFKHNLFDLCSDY
ncbi:MAG: hypothetical protein N4A31_01025 [Rickettsiales bacterium]|jgi:hypothetical protein|nr:hypothetical protein [Rickettsiales bacterium]